MRTEANREPAQNLEDSEVFSVNTLFPEGGESVHDLLAWHACIVAERRASVKDEADFVDYPQPLAVRV